MQADLEYFKLCQKVLDEGIDSVDRTGVGTKSIFGYQMRFDLQKEFPLLTTKKVFWNGVVDELLWFLSGSSYVTDLPVRSQKLWKPWAKNPSGYLGPIYGVQWRNWTLAHDSISVTNKGVSFEWRNLEGFDQIKEVIESIKSNPESRRHIVSAWNVGQLKYMQLPPCHTLFQFYVRNNKLSCQLYQRSGDIFLGIPFNIASYALLTHLIANCCDLEVGEFIHTIGDAHIYNNHLDAIKLQMTRTPFDGPKLILNTSQKDIDKVTHSDIQLIQYISHPSIKGELAI